MLCTYLNKIVRYPSCVTKHTQHFVLENPSAGHVSNLSPIKMSKNETNYFDMELQTLSGRRKWVVYFTKQRYDLFRKVNESQTEGVIIKKAKDAK